MDKQKILQLVDGIFAAHADDVDCKKCQEELDCLAELAVDGYACADILPAVQAHMDCCRTCRELYKGLVGILKAEQSGEC